MKTEISIVTINYKTDKALLNLLKEIRQNNALEIIIIDNSPKETLIKKIPRRSDIKYFFTGKNLGFARGNNFGISKASGEWLLLINSDTITTTDDIIKLVEITKNSGFLVSAPKLAQQDSKIQNNVGYFDKLFTHLINYIFARPRFANCSKVKSPKGFDLLTGAAMLIHRSVLDKYWLDDKNYFMYFEDIDFSLQLHNAGIKVLYVPSVTITHFGGASSDQDSRQKNINYQNGLKVYLTKNRGYMIYYLNKLFGFLK